MFFEFIKSIFNSLFMILHINQTNEFPKALSKEDEAKYLELYEKNGDIYAKNKLIEHNLRLVAHIIKKYYSVGYDQDDLISIGTIGLIKAVNSYTSDKGTRLATYASRCIENEILMHFRASKKTNGDVYMSDPVDIDKDGNTLALIDIISDNTNIVDDIELKIKTEKLYKKIYECLDKREKDIIFMRYGLMGYPELTQREIAKRLGISRSYVSRIEKKALTTLYKNMK
ncbi:MAG: RNA polymerase sporulation sigma factor SigK [Clostridia bacterium]|nr:RNA polymerase sporulation sigma factor SigK [Clostridia bacterium]